MIWQCGATVKLKYTYANEGLIRFNKFFSRIPKDFYNLFYYYYLNTFIDILTWQL
jgi:hypothetical protein